MWSAKVEKWIISATWLRIMLCHAISCDNHFVLGRVWYLPGIWIIREPINFRSGLCKFHMDGTHTKKAHDAKLKVIAGLNKKRITRWQYLNVTRYISSYLFTYLRLSTDRQWTRTTTIRQKRDHNLQLKTFELEFDFAEYIQYIDVQIMVFDGPPIHHLPGNCSC